MRQRQSNRLYCSEGGKQEVYTLSKQAALEADVCLEQAEQGKHCLSSQSDHGGVTAHVEEEHKRYARRPQPCYRRGWDERLSDLQDSKLYLL